MSPQVMNLDEPTRGIDVGAKAEIYPLMRELADGGVVILMISSDMEEILSVGGRIAVMHEGEISGAGTCRLPGTKRDATYRQPENSSGQTGVCELGLTNSWPAQVD